MSFVHDSAIAGASGNQGGYRVERSLRFNSSDSAYLSRTAGTPSSAGTYTLSIWVKRSALNTDYAIFGANSSSGYTQCYFTSDNKLRWYEGPIPGGADIQTTPVFRDTSAWYHFVFVKTGTSSMTIYQNGIQVAQTTSSVPSSSPFNTSSGAIYIGYVPGSGFSAYANSYLADIHFIDGQALTPSSFAETNTTTGQWVPKAYSGSYGTNGFQLKFADNSNNTAATLGKDTSGNGNNWTPNNLSVTAGAGNDSLVDSPTNYGSDTGAGGEVRGNYCTLNPLAIGPSIANANGSLDATRPVLGWASQHCTIGVSSGKWYFEGTAGGTLTDSDSYAMIGVCNSSSSLSNYIGVDTNGWAYNFNGLKVYNGTASYGSGFTGGDIIGVAVDLDNQRIWFAKNGTWQASGNPSTNTNPAFSNLTGTVFPAIGLGGGNTANASWSLNFGQRPFAYTAPSGFKALCDTNLPAPVVAKPSTAFDVKLYTGNGGTNSITGLGFSPDLVWLKNRSGGGRHNLYDVIRDRKALFSDGTDAELSLTAGNDFGTFDSTGFTLLTPQSTAINNSGQTFVAWCWDAGSSTVTNTQGSITSQVRANASAGFSIVTYTGNGSAGATIGHGLGVTPAMIIIKNRDDGGTYWVTYHSALGGTKALALNLTDAALTNSLMFSNTNPTSAVFTVGGGGAFSYSNNQSGENHVAYCFSPVAGYSAMGSYVGNGSATDGPFVFCNFRPRWLLLKNASSGTNWYLVDSARNTYNVVNSLLRPNLSNAELSGVVPVDFLSNGFKIRDNDAGSNANGDTIVWAAFAENPFQYARAR